MKRLICAVGVAGLLAAGTVSANAALLHENFDPINNANWSSITNGTTLGTPAGEFFSGNALWFDSGTTGTSVRQATTVALDLTSSDTIMFRLKIGGPNDTLTFEDADPGEDVVLEYSLDGSSFTNIATFDTEDLAYQDVWGLANIAIPVAAKSNSTYIRWRQIAHSGGNYDNWAIDNVDIDSDEVYFYDVPEPATLALFGLGLAGLACVRRRRSA